MRSAAARSSRLCTAAAAASPPRAPKKCRPPEPPRRGLTKGGATDGERRPGDRWEDFGRIERRPTAACSVQRPSTDAADLHILYSCRSERLRAIIRDEEFTSLLGSSSGIVYAGRGVAASPQWTWLGRIGRECRPPRRHAAWSQTLCAHEPHEHPPAIPKRPRSVGDGQRPPTYVPGHPWQTTPAGPPASAAAATGRPGTS
jgi:hypothetical protein